jgi:hypothetical protein
LTKQTARQTITAKAVSAQRQGFGISLSFQTVDTTPIE